MTKLIATSRGQQLMQRSLIKDRKGFKKANLRHIQLKLNGGAEKGKYDENNRFSIKLVKSYVDDRHSMKSFPISSLRSPVGSLLGSDKPAFGEMLHAKEKDLKAVENARQPSSVKIRKSVRIEENAFSEN